MTVSAAGAAGWYPDPSRRFELRYFNGERWTADVSVHGQRMIDSGEPVGPGRPGWTPTVGERPRGFAIASMITAIVGVVIGWIPFVFVIGAVSALLAVVFGVIGLRVARTHDGCGKSFAVAGLLITPVAVASCVGGFLLTREVWDEVTGTGEYELTEGSCGASSGDVVVFQGTIRNRSSIERDYVLTIELTVGGAVTRTEVDVDNVNVDRSRSWMATERVPGAADGVTCRVTDVHASVFATG